MKRIIRQYVVNVVSLWATQQLVTSFSISGGFQNLLMVAVGLTLLNWFIKPILKILLLPINLLSLGIFSWVINVAIIYILAYFFPQVSIQPWSFAGLTIFGITLPAHEFGIITTYIVVSFAVSIVSSFFNWL